MNLVSFLLQVLPTFISLPQSPVEQPTFTLLSAEQPATEPIFTVVAPFTIRPGKPYNIFVRGFNLTGPLSLTLRLSGQSDTGVAVNITRVANISPAVPRAGLTIATTTIQKGSYSLIVEGANYSQKRTLTFNTRKNVFLIQFNKAIHLPNDTLQYRIFAIDSETFAANPRDVNNITITDPRGNLVASVKNVVFAKGKYENKFQLSPKTRFGIWTLKFQSGEESVEKTFEVAEYKHPLIIGKIITAQHHLYSAGKVPITIDISYTFGKNILGTAQVNISNYGGPTIMSKNIDINSAKTTFDVDIINELNLVHVSSAYYDITLSYEDHFSKAKVLEKATFGVFPRVYDINSYGEMHNMKPGAPYTFTLALRKYDGSPGPAGTKVTVTAMNPTSIPQQTVYLGGDGRALVTVDVPTNTTYLQLRVSSNEANDGFVNAYPSPQRTGSYLDVKIVTPWNSNGVKLNQPVKVKLMSSDIVDFAIVHIISKGVLLKTMTVLFDSDLNEDKDPRTVYFSFIPTIWYIPFAQILAYYIDQNGSFVVGNAMVSIITDLPNYVKIRPSAQEVRPGSEARFNIESYVNSTVSLVAVDQRALLLRSDGNISKSNLFTDFYKFAANYITYDWPMIENYEYTFGGTGLFILNNIPRKSTNTLLSSMGGEVENLASSVIADQSQDPADPSHLLIREDFKETFLWRDVDIKTPLYDDSDFTAEASQFGYETITEKVPESISKYFIYGVSMSSTKGLGLSEDIPSVSIFMPFFISAEFPYSIKRNEILVQDIIIYNYLTEAQAVEVKITKDLKYEAVDLATYGWTEIDGFYTKSITTTVDQHIELQFAIKPKVFGFIPFEITARGPIAGDGLEKQLRVIPEGIPRTITRNVLIPIESPTIRIQQTLQCNLPASAYQDTTEISATVAGEFLGKPLKNIEKLIVFPSGCCEQIASALIPNIVIYLYLLTSNKLTAELKTKLESNIAIGYQNLLRCQKFDGSYSVFSGGLSSTWATSFIIQYLNIASDIITIDPNIVSRGADYLVTQQNSDGSFNETGVVYYGIMQAGSRKGVALTAFCSIVFSSLLAKYPQYATVRDNAITFLEAQFGSVTSTYELGIIAYALQLAGSTTAGTVYNLFNARRNETITDISWKASNTPSSYQQTAISPDVEVTSYGLMTLLSRGEALPKVLKVVQFIISKTNIFGGYGSSHDTVIALNALSQFSKTYALNGTVTVAMTPNVGTAFTARVTPANMLTLQTFQMNSTARSLIARASSTTSGLAIVSLICNFYENPSMVVPQFNITYSYSHFCKTFFYVNICVRYIPPGTSNMALLVVTMPSGILGSVNGQPTGVSFIETSNSGTDITFYYNTIGNNETCVNLFGSRKNYVVNLKDGIISAYDYYDTSKQGVASFSANLPTTCQ